MIEKSANQTSSCYNLSAIYVPKNEENCRLIWLGTVVDDSDYLPETLKRLREVNQATQVYSEVDCCIDLIKSIRNENVLLVISGALAQEAIPRVEQLQVVSGIFILCDIRPNYVWLLEKYAVVVEIFTQQESLFQSIRMHIILIEKQTLTFTLISQKQPSLRNLSKGSATFVWYQLLVNMLCQLPQMGQEKMDMVRHCADYYHENKQEIERIELFRTTYTSDQAVKWYTKSYFVFRLVNQALRTGNIEQLYRFRFFIVDLCAQLAVMKDQLNNRGKLTLYRGQRISVDELEKLKRNVGSLISMNGFLSTSRDKAVALRYVHSTKQISSKNMKSVLFEIEADASLNSMILADIGNQNDSELEDEVLFSIGTVFKIDACDFQQSNDMWVIKLLSTNEGSTRTEEYLTSVKQDLDSCALMIDFGRILYHMDQADRAVKYFHLLLKTLPQDHPDIGDVYNGLGYVYQQLGDNISALEKFQQAYEIRLKYLPPDHSHISASLRNIGSVYAQRSDYDRALDYYQRAMSIVESNYLTDHMHKAMVVECIGNLYRSVGKLDDALLHLSNVLSVCKRLGSIQHPMMASCLGSIGLVYLNKGDLDLALDCFQQQLKIEEETLPPDHSNLTTHFQLILNVYEKMNKREKALDFCQKKLAAQKESSARNHSRIACILMIIGDLLGGSEEVVKYYHEALSVLENYTSDNYAAMIKCRKMLGIIYMNKGNTEDGLRQWMQVLDIERYIYTPDHLHIAETLAWVGDILSQHLYRHSQAIKYYFESLKIYEVNYGLQHEKVLEIKQRLDNVQRTSDVYFNVKKVESLTSSQRPGNIQSHSQYREICLGFDARNKDAIGASVICPICSLILRNPVQLVCGHRQCRPFIEQQEGLPIKCVLCQEESPRIKVMLDRGFQKDMEKLNILCAHCDWTGIFQNYQEHLDDFHANAICTFCYERFKSIAELDQHKLFDCKLVPFQCSLQGWGCTHDQVCGFSRYFASPQSAFSSSDKILRCNRQKHNVSERHQKSLITCLHQCFSKLKIDNRRTSGTTNSVDNYHDRSLKIQSTYEALNVLSERIETLNNEIRRLSDKSLKHQCSLQTGEQYFSTVKLAVQEADAFLNIAEPNQQILQQECESIKQRLEDIKSVSYDGTLLWKIPNYQEKMADAQSERQTSIYSPCFYSSPTGYKMRARLYLNGDGNARRTHLSLFFVLMRTKHDALLKFPFNFKVTFCMFDQTGQQRHIIDSFRPDTKSASFQRPYSDMNIASGIPKFFPLSLLEQPDNPYIRDDTMFIKVLVDFGDMPKAILPYALTLNPGLPAHTQQAMIYKEIEKRRQEISLPPSAMQVQQ